MKLFSTSQIEELDTYTIKHEPIQSIDLMERAAHAFTDAFCLRFPELSKIIVFAGPGNNGGDALAIARMLYQKDYPVEVYLFNKEGKLSADCLTNKKRLQILPQMRITEVKDTFVPPDLGKNDIVIDGLFGSGLNRPLEGGFASVVKYINSSPSTVVSIDMPSGLFGEDNSGNNNEHIITADYTYTFQFPKLSFLFSENESFAGKVEVLDIGLHPEKLNTTTTPFHLIQKEDVNSLLKKRSRFAHKGNFGHALLIAGSLGKMGAAVLAGKACLHSGAGLLTVHIPKSGNGIVQTSLPEAMTSIDDDECIFSCIPKLKSYNAIAAGPGIGTDEITVGALTDLLQQSENPVILDADALNIIAKDSLLLELIPQNSILTPHPKEFDRLAGPSASSYERLHKAMDFAKSTKTYLILKGRYTAVCTPEGECWFNPTGNPGMATAGSGDVLTGILLGLLAQSYTPAEASLLGVYLHGLAGDIALEDNSEESLLSGDIIRYIGVAFKEISYICTHN